MNRFILILVLGSFIALVSLSSAPAHAAKAPDQIASKIGLTLPIDKVHLAIVRAGTMKGWTMTQVEPGHLECIVQVRSHVAVVDIRFDETQYTITYNRSENLDYTNGKIDKKFNSWVRRLDRDIQVMLTYM